MSNDEHAPVPKRMSSIALGPGLGVVSVAWPIVTWNPSSVVPSKVRAPDHLISDFINRSPDAAVRIELSTAIGQCVHQNMAPSIKVSMNTGKADFNLSHP